MTTPHRHREETLNTLLAIVLARHGVAAESETIQYAGRHRPDVMFHLNGLRVILEGKFADTPDAESLVFADAQKRLDAGICHIAVAVVYPAPLRTLPTAVAEKELASSLVRFVILTENGATEWAESKPTEILCSLRRVHEALTKDDIVAKSAENLSRRIEGIAELWVGQPATCERLSDLLGIYPKVGETAEERSDRRVTATKIAALVLANAMIFQEQLAVGGGDGRVDSLRAYDHDPDPIASLKENWRWIWQRINYVPIFQLGEKILQELPVSQSAVVPVRWLIEEAKSICLNQSALRHDLMGRIYHWLLYHAKYLGTYYTATSSATLLLKLTLAQPWPVDFGSPKKLVDFVAADLACGTGTLLMATAQAVTDQFIVSRAKAGLPLGETEMRHLHQALMENILQGYDVLPSAVHLTASTLGMLASHVTFRRMNLFIMPMGVEHNTRRLGSLDFIKNQRVPTQLTLDDTQMEAKRTGVDREIVIQAEIQKMDLCVMNPPFVRSVGGNLLFGSLSDREREILQTELKRCTKGLHCSVTAGLGSVFMALADKYLKTGGRLAFVLPVGLATGEAWGSSRQLLAQGYHVETVVVSHDANRPNFSENTDLSELMFIARKLKPDEPAGDTVFINLWHNPHTTYEAMELAGRINSNTPAKLEGSDTMPLMAGSGRKLGEMVSVPPTMGEAQWLGAQFAQTWTLRIAARLEQGLLTVPGHFPVKLAFCSLGTLGALGPDRKRIHEGFKPSDYDWSPYRGFWNHDAKKVVKLAQKPNTYLTVWTKSPRGSDYGSRRLWPRAGNILLVERLRGNTHRVIAVKMSEDVLGNTWWAFKSDLSSDQQKALLLWLNSSPSILMLLSHRVTTHLAWMQIKQPQWVAMPVLDVRTLDEKALHQLAWVYDRVCGMELKPLAQLDTDPVRAEIDSAFSLALGLPDMQKLRELLAREPGLTGKGLSYKPGQEASPEDEGADEVTAMQLDLF